MSLGEVAGVIKKYGIAVMAVGLGWLAGGCAVGPNFKPPAPPPPNAISSDSLTATAGATNIVDGAAQTFGKGIDIPGDWWVLFHSEPLNALIREAISNNPDLSAAHAALAVAHENVLAQRGNYFPNVAAGFSATRQKQSEVLAPVPNYPAVPNSYQYNLFTPQLSVGYSPDVFGANRRAMESLKAQEQGTRYQMAATYTTLTANVVVTAIQEGATQQQIEATRQLAEVSSNMLVILRYQLTKGYVSRLDVLAQESQLAQTLAALPPLVKQAGQLRDQLAVLVGRFPGDAPEDKFDLASLQLPVALPMSLPSELVQQRPDVLQAQANLHAACAQVGVSVANRLPNITLSADAGSSALAIDKVFTSGTGFWALGAAASAPLFQGGTLRHAERAARAAYRESAEQYRSTVLTAFQNVADTLIALGQDAEALKTAAVAEEDAAATMALSKHQLRDGYISYLALLNAEQAYQQARLNLIQAQANRFSDTAALFQALGGGWWHRADLTDDSK